MYKIEYVKDNWTRTFNVDNLYVAIDIYVALKDSLDVKGVSIEKLENKDAN